MMPFHLRSSAYIRRHLRLKIPIDLAISAATLFSDVTINN